ncbi:MAG: lipoyl synthase [Bacteroidetes bacterium]|nr:lipoyl synthase [Bacteroidota bacterium]
MPINRRKPDWLKIKLPKGESYLKVKEILHGQKLHTICESGKCPNLSECWEAGTATFMILGDICTRSCKFCNTKTGIPLPVDKEEPQRVADSIKSMNLKHCVITSVDRDDLPDGGSYIWAETIHKIREVNPNTTIEVLIPDFNGIEADINRVIEAKPDIISHNLETVRRLTAQVRRQARYNLSLRVLKQIADSGIVAKSGVMLGLGETEEELFESMDDLLASGVSVITIGQYLQPTAKHLPVIDYVTPEKFTEYGRVALKKGFRVAESGPLVRSSYHAERHV